MNHQGNPNQLGSKIISYEIIWDLKSYEHLPHDVHAKAPWTLNTEYPNCTNDLFSWCSLCHCWGPLKTLLCHSVHIIIYNMFVCIVSWPILIRVALNRHLCSDWAEKKLQSTLCTKSQSSPTQILDSKLHASRQVLSCKNSLHGVELFWMPWNIDKFAIT